MSKNNRNNPLRKYQNGHEWTAALSYIRAKTGTIKGISELSRAAISSIAPYCGLNLNTGPKYAAIDLSYRCQARCLHCGRSQQELHDELTTDEIFRIIKELAEAGTRFICIAGGEPLLVKDLPDIIRYIKKLGLCVSICTNGALLAERSDALINAHTDHIIVSMDGKPESHDKMRGVRGLFQHAELGIRSIIKKRIKDGTTISCRMLLHEDNLDEIAFFVSYWNEVVDSILLQPLHNGSHNLYRLTDGLQIVSSIGKLKSILHDTGLDKNFYNALMPDYLEDPKRFCHLPCLAGHWVVRITPTGDVYPCVEQLQHVGNLRKQSFKEIWNGNTFNYVRKRLATSKNCTCFYNDMFMNIYMWQAHEKTECCKVQM
ncbi:MAG: radical SAM protein [Proteobacteria bacterium]|nr:radical SAM protein [Pseudomonadota bacterium]